MRGSARTTRTISWAPSGWLVTGTSEGVSTDTLTLACSDDFHAVRVGFTNIDPAPYTIPRVIAVPSTTANDYVNPTGNVSWRPLTFAGHGAPQDTIVTSPDAPSSITVHGCLPTAASADMAIPRWTWTDWAPISSVPRTDTATGFRLLMLRVLLPAGCRYTRPNGGFNEYHATASLNRGFAYVAGHLPVDFVSHPSVINASRAELGRSKSPVSCVQFLTRHEGVVAMTTGDSHHQGTGTTTQFMNYLLRAITEVGAPYAGRVPVGYWSTARGGADSGWFFPSLTNVLEFARPSLVVLPGWTYNETTGPLHADQAANEVFLSRLIMAVEACKRHGALPILLTPLPRDRASMTEMQVLPWRGLRDVILGLKEHGLMVVDGTSLLGRKSQDGYDGTYLPEYSDDGVHPNDAGHATLAAALTPLLRDICNLP